VTAIDEGEQSPLGSTAGPRSVSSQKLRSASARTIFGRAFHGLKRTKVDERGSPNPAVQATDDSTGTAAKTPCLTGDSSGRTESAEGELSKLNKIAMTAARMPNIPRPHLRRTDQSKVALARLQAELSIRLSHAGAPSKADLQIS
jgi:hypothetical protein